jgi:hypothetical protein
MPATGTETKTMRGSTAGSAAQCNTVQCSAVQEMGQRMKRIVARRQLWASAQSLVATGVAQNEVEVE